MSEYILEIRNCRKEFPGVVALDSVSLFIRRGEIHALVGENGAGKSTIMKILAGIYTPDAGEILYDGKPLRVRRPIDALRLGISMVQQELDLIPLMSVAENVFAGSEPTKGIVVDRKHMNEKTREMMRELDIDIDPRTKVCQLSTAQQQMVAIVRAIAFNADIVILDEPTSAITDREITKLFRILRKLRDKNKAIIYISHKMDEIFSLTDRITVLRDGKLIGTTLTKDTTPNQLIHMMVGRELKDIYIKNAPKQECFDENEVIMQVSDLTCDGKFRNISFDLKRGEILGVYGLMGAGRTETMEAIFGLRKTDSGSVVVKGKEIYTTKEAIKNKMAFITEDRKLYGLNLIASVKDNISIVYLAKVLRWKWIMHHKKERLAADDLIRRFRIKCASRNTLAGTLSGGNQQKIVIAKWIMGDPNILIMDEPTRGIDIGAKSEIYKLIDEMAKAGKGIIMISSETPELIGMSDRIIVMHDGQITGILGKEDVDQDKLMTYAIGERS